MTLESPAADPRARLAALKAILDAGDARRCPQIAQSLPQEPHPKVRAAMVMVLARLGGKAHANVIARFTEDPDVGVRLRAVEALARVPSADCAGTLVRVLGHEPEPRVRDVAAHYLMACGSDALLALFRDMLASDKPWKREASVRACQMFNSPLVVPLLAHAAVTEPLEPIRDSARAGLERLAGEGNPAAAQALARLRAREQPPVESAPEPLPPPQPARALAFGDSYRGGKLRRVEIEDDLAEGKAPKPGAQQPQGRTVFAFFASCAFCASRVFPFGTEYDGRTYCGKSCMLAANSERGGFCEECHDSSTGEDYGGCRFGGPVGTSFLFAWLKCGACGSQIYTKWFLIGLVPVFPLGCYRTFRLGGGKFLTRRVPTRFAYYGRDLAVPVAAILILLLIGALTAPSPGAPR